MARRVLAAVALLALAIAGAASAGLLSPPAVDPPAPSTSCLGITALTTGATSTAATSSLASPAVTTVGATGTKTVTPVGAPQSELTTKATTTSLETTSTSAATGRCASASPLSVSTPTPAPTAATATGPTLTTNGAASTLVITGHGWGHGMGMAQWGAYGYALHGWGYERILRHYYPGTTIAVRSSPNVRVLLLDHKRRVTLASAEPWHAVDGAGRRVELPAGKLVVPATLELAGRKLRSPVTFAPGHAPVEVGKSAYRGHLVVTSNGSRLQVVNVVDMESYVQGVVGGEVPNYWPASALEAQAVAARTYALAELSTVVTAGTFDLYDDTRSQVYEGISAETPSILAAVAATAGRVVLYDGKVATTYFSSSSGGETVSAAEALGTPIPYLVSVSDPYDTLSPNHDWGPVLMSAGAVGKALGLGGPVDGLSTSAGLSGHVAEVTASGLESQRTLSGDQVEADLGLRSSWFAFGWLTLTPPAEPLAAGASVALGGMVRGVTGVTLESRVAGGAWETVGPVTPDGTGSFTIRGRPAGTTQYRLSAGAIRGALIRVTVA